MLTLALLSLLSSTLASDANAPMCKVYTSFQALNITNLAQAPKNVYAACMDLGKGNETCKKVEKVLSFATEPAMAARCDAKVAGYGNVFKASESVNANVEVGDPCPACGWLQAAECAGSVAGCLGACIGTGGAACLECVEVLGSCCSCASHDFGFDCSDC
jgi:hypothetical protein